MKYLGMQILDYRGLDRDVIYISETKISRGMPSDNGLERDVWVALRTIVSIVFVQTAQEGVIG